MYSKFALPTLALVLASAALVGCSKEPEVAGPSKEAVTAAEKNTFKAQRLPSIYENDQYKALALAADGPAQTLIKAAQETTDLAKLTPLIKDFMAKRDALLMGIADQQLRHSAFRDFMEKNMGSPEQRKAYAAAMTAYHKANSPAQAGGAKPPVASGNAKPGTPSVVVKPAVPVKQ